MEIVGRNEFWRNAVFVEWEYQFPERKLEPDGSKFHLIEEEWFEDLRRVAAQRERKSRRSTARRCRRSATESMNARTDIITLDTCVLRDIARGNPGRASKMRNRASRPGSQRRWRGDAGSAALLDVLAVVPLVHHVGRALDVALVVERDGTEHGLELVAVELLDHRLEIGRAGCSGHAMHDQTRP